MNKYYALATSGRTADINIFGDITSWEWFESDVSSYTLSKEIQGLDADVINVHINSHGGEVGEGLAIYNMLKNHKAKVITYCEGFACSIASVIFMAGDERIMRQASLAMIHPVLIMVQGNAKELRKTADDLETITQVTIESYKQHVNISDEKLNELLEAETWLSPQMALEMGFATSISSEEPSKNPSQNVRQTIVNMVMKAQAPTREFVDAEDVVAKLIGALAKIEPQQKQAEPEPQEPEQPQAEQPQAEQPEQNKFINLLNALSKC